MLERAELRGMGHGEERERSNAACITKQGRTYGVAGWWRGDDNGNARATAKTKRMTQLAQSRQLSFLAVVSPVHAAQKVK